MNKKFSTPKIIYKKGSCIAAGVTRATSSGGFKFLQCSGEKSCGFAVPQSGPQRAPAVQEWRCTADANWRSASAEPGP